MKDTSASDYEMALSVMALAPVRLALAALPVMRQVVARALAIIPELTSRVLHLVQRLALPSPGGRPGGAVPCRELRLTLNGAAFNWLTTLGRAAAKRFNEAPSDAATAGE